MKKNILLTNQDFPSLYQAADKASTSTQSNFMWLLRIDLILLVFGSLLSSISFDAQNTQIWMNITAAAFLIIAFFISLALKFTRYEHSWYGSRAVAESVKSLSWLYMTRTEPFNSSLPETEADRLFTERLSKLLLEKKNLAVDFENNIADQISLRMKSLRKESTLNRKKKYLSERIKEQRKWYSEKSKCNKTQEWKFFLSALILQLISMRLALYQIKNPHSMNFVAVFSAGTTSIFSWMQTKKFQELAQAYSLTTQELSLVEANAASIKNDNDLSKFVSDAENAISREHTMWIARRRH